MYQMENMAAYFKPGGPVAQAVPGFVYRQEQADLAQSIAEAFSRREFWWRKQVLEWARPMPILCRLLWS